MCRCMYIDVDVCVARGMLLVVWILRPKYFAGGQHNYLIICNWRAGGGRLVFEVVWIFVFFFKSVFRPK